MGREIRAVVPPPRFGRHTRARRLDAAIERRQLSENQHIVYHRGVEDDAGGGKQRPSAIGRFERTIPALRTSAGREVDPLNAMFVGKLVT